MGNEVDEVSEAIRKSKETHEWESGILKKAAVVCSRWEAKYSYPSRKNAKIRTRCKKTQELLNELVALGETL